MILTSTLLFYFSIFMVFYIYIGYPLCILALSTLLKKGVNKNQYLPTITILIAAYNEEKSIDATIQNKLDLQYPKEIMEIIIISDASTDNTDNIVRQYTDRGVRLLRQDKRSGKTAALNMAMLHAKGEIIVFSDANSIYSVDAIQKLAENFSDSSVGYVTGKMVLSGVLMIK